MKIGFTGTAMGMTDSQKEILHTLLFQSDKPCEFHHGDCVGADEEAHVIAVANGLTPVIHPPLNPSKRAYCVAEQIRSEREYLDRNKDIVDDTEMLIAAPQGDEVLRSGTWSTVRYARKRRRKIIIIRPSGVIYE